ncbi:fruit bromelain-like [Rosa sericea]
MGFHRRNLFIPVLCIILFIPVLCIILLIGTSQVAASDNQENPVNVSQVFEEWMVKYNRVYKSKEEKEKRFAIFKTTFEFVENFKKHRKHESYTVGLNNFADITNAEMPRGIIIDSP